MHFATDDDESVQVPACRNFDLDENIREVLAWDNSKNRILNWDQLQDETKLDEIMLFNPKPFKLQTAFRPASMLRKRSHARVVSRLHDDVVDVNDWNEKKQKTPYDVQHKLPKAADHSVPKSKAADHSVPKSKAADHSVPKSKAADHSVPKSKAADHSVPKSEPWPAPDEDESEWIKKQWEIRSRPHEKDSEMLRRAYDAATLENLRRQEKTDQAQIDADKKKIGELETKIFEAEAQKQELETQLFGSDARIDEETRKNLCSQIAAINKAENECERQKWNIEREIESKQKEKEIALENLKETQAAAQASHMYYIISSFRNI
jgi:hypothetical protein